MEITLSTRSDNKELAERAQSLCNIKDKRVLSGLSDYEYLIEAIWNSKGDWLIDIHDDCFIWNMSEVEAIIQWCEWTRIDIIGAPSTGIRENGKFVTFDSGLHIINLNRVRQYKPIDLLKYKAFTTKDYYNEFTYSDAYWECDKHEFLFLDLLKKGATFDFIKTTFDFIKNKDDGIETYSYFNTFAVHTRESRNYNEDKNTKKRIDEAYEYALNKRV